MKRAIYPLYAPSDEGQVKPILNALAARGLTVRSGAAPGKGDALVLFLSENLADNERVADDFFRLNPGRELVIPVNLDGCTPPEELQNALMARHTLDGAKYSAQELAERIARAALGERKSRLPLVLSLMGVAALLVVGGLIAWNRMGKPDLKSVFAQATDTPAPTAEPTPAPTPTPTAVPTPTPPLPDNADITLEQLERVFELIIVGDSFNFYTGDEEWMQGSGNARVGVEHVAYRGFENGEPRWYSTEDGREFGLYDWGDLAFLPYMKNLTLLTLVNVQGTLPDLSGLKNLGCVEVLDCAIDDVSGVKDNRLEAFSYSGPAIDLSPLNESSRLGNVSLRIYGGGHFDLSAFGPGSLRSLTVDAMGFTGTVDLSGLKNAVDLVDVRLNDLPVTDLDCLSEAGNLQYLWLDDLRLTSLHGLEDHAKLNTLSIDNCFSLSDLSALNSCTYLKTLAFQDCPISDLSFLTGTTYLFQLEAQNMPSLHSLHGLEEHKSLQQVEIHNLHGLNDISALASCTGLTRLLMHEVFALRDIRPVVELPQLRSLEIYGSEIRDVDFLWDIRNKDNFSFGIAEVEDWKGLQAIENYQYLNVTDRNGSALPFIQNATVKRLEIYNRNGGGNQSEGMDLALLPHVTQEMWLHCVTTLEGLDQPDVQWLQVDNCPYLSSLDGLEGVPKLKYLNVINCSRLTDWTALNGRKLEELGLEALFTLPDFGKIDVQQVGLTTIYDLRDLSCFDEYQPSRPYRISLMDMDGITDLSPLYRLHGSKLWVPAHLMEQAQVMVDSGLLDEYEVTYPEGWWEPIEPHIELMNLEEIDTLPSALLSRVTRLNLAGDQVLPNEGAWVEEDWRDDPPALFVRYDGIEERFPVEPGTLTSFEGLTKLTGLVDMNLFSQPQLTSLEGIEALGDLRYLKINQCPALTDASAAFTLQSLEELRLRFTGISSLQGIQNLYALKQLDVNDSPIEDLSPIGALSNLEEVNFQLPMMTFEELMALPEALRQQIQNLTFAGDYVYDGGPWWFEEDWITDPPKLYLHSNETDERLPLSEGPITDMAELAALVPNLENLNLYAQPLTTLDGIEGLGQLRRINVEECRQVVDFDPLWRMPSLEEIGLRNEPIESIEGIENMPRLVSLSLSGTNVRDFSPLERVDYSYCTSEENDGRGFNLAADVRDAESLPFEAYAPLEAVPVYWNLNLNNVPVKLWYDHIMGKELREFSCHRCDMSNEQLKSFVENHPMLEELTLSWNPQLTDISCLREVPDSHLRELWVSGNMQKAVASLGEGYGFELRMDD